MTFNSLSYSSLKADNSSTLHQMNVFSMEMLDDPALREGLGGTRLGIGHHLSAGWWRGWALCLWRLRGLSGIQNSFQ